MDESIIGFGAFISVNDGASNAHVLFKNVLTVSLPDREFGEYETTLLRQLDADSKLSKDRTFAPTLRDNGSVPVEGMFTKAEYTRLVGLQGVKGKEFILTSPDADGNTSTLTPLKATFKGFVKKVGGVKFEKDKEVMCTFEIRVSGPIKIEDGTNESANP